MKNISGSQRACGEWYGNAIRLDNLYRATPDGKASRQVIRADKRVFEKEIEGLKKKQDRRIRRTTSKVQQQQVTMSDDMLKGNVTI